jgi:hypothetical protein
LVKRIDLKDCSKDGPGSFLTGEIILENQK